MIKTVMLIVFSLGFIALSLGDGDYGKANDLAFAHCVNTYFTNVTKCPDYHNLDKCLSGVNTVAWRFRSFLSEIEQERNKCPELTAEGKCDRVEAPKCLAKLNDWYGWANDKICSAYPSFFDCLLQLRYKCDTPLIQHSIEYLESFEKENCRTSSS